MKITSVEYFSVASKDRPGEVARLANTLREHQVDLAGLWGLAVGAGESEVIAVPTDPEKFVSVAQEAGIIVTAGTCFHIEADDRVGALTDLLNAISIKGVNLHGMTSLAVNGKVGGYFWATEKDVAAIKEALGDI